jgi:hypothetical protein
MCPVPAVVPMVLRSSPARKGRCCMDDHVRGGAVLEVAILTEPGGPVLRKIITTDGVDYIALRSSLAPEGQCCTLPF